MSRNPFAYARLGNCEKSSASISASRAGRILVMRAASSRVRLRARLASSNFLPIPSIVMMGGWRLNGSVKVDKNLARFSAFAGTQNTALLQNINDARGTGVTESQPPLKQGRGGAFFLPNDFKTFLHQLFVFLRYFFFWRCHGLQFLLHLRIKSRWALRGNEFNEPTNLIIGHKYTLGANEARGARREVQHIALPKQSVGAVFVKDDATVDLGCNLECNPARNIRFDDAGNDIRPRRLRGYDQMNASGPGHLGDPRDRGLNVGWRRLHQIGQLIDNDYDVGNFIGNDQLVFARNLDFSCGSSIGGNTFRWRHVHLFRINIDVFLFYWSSVEASDVANASPREDFITTFHFIDQPP